MAPDRRRQLTDGAVATWVVTWVILAVVVGIDVRRLGELSATLRNAGIALGEVGSAVHTLSHLPFVGHDLARLAGRITATSSSAQQNAVTSRSSTDQLSYLLPLVVAVVPVVPVLALYLPVRLQRRREARALVMSVRNAQDPQRSARFLAQRAVVTLPFHQLERVSPDPWADLDAGRYADLAAAELMRLGIEPHTVLDPGSAPSNADDAPAL
jgi:hypothetical protein